MNAADRMRRMIVMRRFLPLVVLAVLFAPVLTARQQATTATSRASETALDRYVAAPDAAFSWKVAAAQSAGGVTVTTLDMTSQQWLTEADVEQPLWRHWVTVITPATVTSDLA